MIELTTGIAFLVSSLYGGAQAQASTTANIQTGNTNPTVEQTSKLKSGITETSFINSKVVEAYVKAQYADEPILVDIARCESTYRQFDKSGNILRGEVNSADVGVMQINEKYHADEAVKLGLNIYTTEGNVAFAKYLYKKYGGDPWSSSEGCWSEGNQVALK